MWRSACVNNSRSRMVCLELIVGTNLDRLTGAAHRESMAAQTLRWRADHQHRSCARWVRRAHTDHHRGQVSGLPRAGQLGLVATGGLHSYQRHVQRLHGPSNAGGLSAWLLNAGHRVLRPATRHLDGAYATTMMLSAIGEQIWSSVPCLRLCAQTRRRLKLFGLQEDQHRDHAPCTQRQSRTPRRPQLCTGRSSRRDGDQSLPCRGGLNTLASY